MLDELNENLSESKIRKAINQLKPEKSCGPDNLVNESFRYGMGVLIPYLY